MLSSGHSKSKMHRTFFGMSILLSGDFMQLPPVAAASLADVPAPDPAEDPSPAESAAVRQKRLAALRGQSLWRNISSCIVLDTAHRAHGQQFLSEMREGTISHQAWAALLSRRLPPHDPRVQASCFWSNDACIGVLRHRVRAIACLQRALHLARLAGQRLLVCTAVDSCRTTQSSSLAHPLLLQYLCSVPNLTETKNLPGVLFLWHGCHLTLETKISEEHGLVRGCPCILRHVLFHEDELPFDSDSSLPPHILSFLPMRLIVEA